MAMQTFQTAYILNLDSGLFQPGGDISVGTEASAVRTFELDTAPPAPDEISLGDTVIIRDSIADDFQGSLIGVDTTFGDPVFFITSGSTDFPTNSYVWITDQTGVAFGSPFDYQETTFTILCFGAGTRIATASGDCAVEALSPGMMVRTARGGFTKVLWIGAQTVRKLFLGQDARPVRIRAGALGAALPDQDLVVTADHGMVIDGYIINASALVNGDTIDFVPLAELEERFTVYHVETEHHDVILANGAPAETFIDVAGRRGFDNYQDYLDLCGHERLIQAQALPRISSARLVPNTIKDRLSLIRQTVLAKTA